MSSNLSLHFQIDQSELITILHETNMILNEFDGNDSKNLVTQLIDPNLTNQCIESTSTLYHQLHSILSLPSLKNKLSLNLFDITLDEILDVISNDKFSPHSNYCYIWDPKMKKLRRRMVFRFARKWLRFVKNPVYFIRKH